MQVSIAAVCSCWRFWMTVFHGTLPCPLALTFFLPTLSQCSLGLGGVGTDRDVPNKKNNKNCLE